MDRHNLTRASRARVRARVRRAIAKADDEAHEGGELNLVPYLDILVNTVIFLLATTVSVVPLANVRAEAPRYVPPPRVGAGPGALNLTVAVSAGGFIVGGAGGVLRNERGMLPTIAFEGTPSARHLAALGKLAATIKKQHPGERRVHLTADARVPYRIVVRTADVLRGRSTARCTGTDGCMFDRVVFAAGVR
jgi:biopolymer transport protein TolR